MGKTVSEGIGGTLSPGPTFLKRLRILYSETLKAAQSSFRSSTGPIRSDPTPTPPFIPQVAPTSVLDCPPYPTLPASARAFRHYSRKPSWLSPACTLLYLILDLDAFHSDDCCTLPNAEGK